MRSLFEPHLVNDPFGDPGLYVDFREEGRALLFDLGDISALPPRRLMRLSHVFVTHAHMDHFSGFDQLLRVVLGRKASLVLYGGPDFVSQVEHKLRAYTWNIATRSSWSSTSARSAWMGAGSGRAFRAAAHSCARTAAHSNRRTMCCTRA